MTPLALIIVMLVAEALLSPKWGLRYRNVVPIFAALIIFGIQLLANIVLDLLNLTPPADVLYEVFLVVQILAMVLTKLYVKRKDKLTKYGMPKHYSSGWRFSFISVFYDYDEFSPNVYAKSMTAYIGCVAFACIAILMATFGYQMYTFSSVGNTFMVPYPAFGLLSILMEFGIFCMGESKWKQLYDRYKKRVGCHNRRELAQARYGNYDDYNYLFRRNHQWEYSYITRSVKIRWKQNQSKSTITYYSFADKSVKEYLKRERNVALEHFIEKNQLAVNEHYVEAYNLIDDNQNVLIKTPSYVDFEPYLTALIKMKVAKTQKTVLVVSSEEKKSTTIQKLKRAFEEYFGFDAIPVIQTIDECVENKKKRERAQEERMVEKRALSQFEELAEKAVTKDEFDIEEIEKGADIILATPEDICDPENVDVVRTIVTALGLIVYYDFSDCVQEEAIFARIVHSVLDYDDKISTLYMSDGFFDLEQVLDNFFSKRNLYRVVVPRKNAAESYITGWKAENVAEMQSRTFPDASRNIGNHIPVLYDGISHTSNDLMVVEDEFDAYCENFENFSQDDAVSRFDFHVGWTDLYGGRSVMCAVSDTYNNAAHTYKALSGIGTSSEYINIISRPYLLRNYLMYHLRYFSEHPGVLSTYSPGTIKTPRAIAYEACVKAYIVGCTEEQLKKYAAEASLIAAGEPKNLLGALVEVVYGEMMEDIKVEVDLYNRYHLDAGTYEAIIQKSGFIEKIYFVNNNKVLERNKRAYPCLIPQQKVVLNGVKYTIEKVEGDRVEITDSNAREPIYVNRPVHTCTVDVKKSEQYASIVQNGGESSITFKRYECDAEITMHGNVIFKDNYHPFNEQCRFDYQEVMDKPVKSYKDVNMFCISITHYMINRENADILGHLFALILNEMLPTFFPKYFSRILIGCNGWCVDEALDKNSITTKNIAAQMDVNDADDVTDNEICLYILEDSSLETGLINVFWQDEEFKYMLKTMEDYLYFIEVIRKEEFKNIFALEDRAHLHLLRRILLEVINETYDLSISKQPMYLNSIRRTRNKFNQLDYHRLYDMRCDFCGRRIVSNTREPEKYHFYAYSGKVSCPSCYAKAVCSEKYSMEGIAALKGLINQWFNKRYGEVVNHRFYNYLEDAELLAELSGDANGYIVTDDADTDGVAGLSYYDVEDLIGAAGNAEHIPVTLQPKYFDLPPSECSAEDFVRASYWIEEALYPKKNSAPDTTETDSENAQNDAAEDMGFLSFVMIQDGMEYRQYMGVLCHEMTHQWQSKNLNKKKLRANTPGTITNEFGRVVALDTMRSEGHAEWERIQYCKKHYSWFAMRHEIAQLKARLDPYGEGYKWMEKMMRVGGDDLSIQVDRTPEFIRKRNWYQFTKNSFKLMRLYFGNSVESVPEPEEEVPVETTDTDETATE